MRFSNSVFFHESTIPIPLSNPPKYFRKYFRFRGDIHENIILILGNNTRKSLDNRVWLPGNRYEKILFREYPRENENIFENMSGGYSKE